jgi:orotidine-5'-phosphate decarboxylase
MAKHFADALLKAVHERQTPCIVGLDPSIGLMPENFLKTRELTAAKGRIAKARALHAYCRLIINEVHDLVAAVKIQRAYFDMYGYSGIQALEDTVDYARQRGLLVILDANAGGAAATSKAYVRAHLRDKSEGARVDAITVSPYLGHESMHPFIEATGSTGHGIFVAVKSTSPESTLVQRVVSKEGYAAWLVVAEYLREHSMVHRGDLGYCSIGVGVGVTQPDAAEKLRSMLPNNIFLLSGVGARGGSFEDLDAFFTTQGLGAVVTSSRAINYPQRFAPMGKHGDGSVRGATLDFIDQMRDVVPSIEI